MLLTHYEAAKCNGFFEEYLCSALYIRNRFPFIPQYYSKLLRLFVYGRPRVLDLNAMFGDTASYVARHGYECVAYNRDERLHALARFSHRCACPRLEFRSGSWQDERHARSFSAVIGSNMLSHLAYEDDVRRFFCHVQKCMAEYGVLIFDFMTPENCGAVDRDFVNVAGSGRVSRSQHFIMHEQAALVDWDVSYKEYEIRCRSFNRAWQIPALKQMLGQCGFGSVRFFGVPADTRSSGIPAPAENDRLTVCLARKLPQDSPGFPADGCS